MSSLIEYIKWYSEFSFYDKPFNEVDNLVLSCLAYYKFDLKKSEGRPAQLKRCLVGGGDFANAARESVRFGQIVVSDYVDIFDKKASAQFAAVKFRLSEGLYYIAFRGTDNTMVGWREDFMMSYKSTVGQQQSVSYLEKAIGEGEYYVGGHSKGGHLAVYGCCHLGDEQLRRVKRIYNNDGPGLCAQVSDVSLAEKVRTRITLILPQYCIFGKLFAQKIPDTKIVKSSNKGIMQHDIASWRVDCGELDRASDFDSDSLWLNDIADKWLSDVEPDKREKLINSFFDAFDENGVITREQILSGGVEEAQDLLMNMVESDSVKTAAKLPEKVVFGDLIDRLQSGKLKKFISANQLVEGIIFAAVGLLMLIFNKNALHVIVIVLLGGVVAFQLWYTVKKLHESHWDFARERTRVYIFLVILTLFALVLVKEQATFIVGSGIAGGWLLVIAYRSFIAAKESGERDFAYYKNTVKAIVYLICGAAVLVTPLGTLKWIMLALGVIMAIDGVCTIVYSVINANGRYEKSGDSK